MIYRNSQPFNRTIHRNEIIFFFFLKKHPFNPIRKNTHEFTSSANQVKNCAGNFWRVGFYAFGKRNCQSLRVNRIFTKIYVIPLYFIGSREPCQCVIWPRGCCSRLERLERLLCMDHLKAISVNCHYSISQILEIYHPNRLL